MNRVLQNQLKEYLLLNPYKVNDLFDKYGIRKEEKVSVSSVIDAYRYFKEPFAVDLFNTLYPEIKAKMTAPQYSYADGDDPSSQTTNQEVSNRTDFWTGFSSVLNSLALSAPAITDSLTQYKYGYPSQQTSPPYPSASQGGAPPYQAVGFNTNILIYIAVGFVALLGFVFAMKKM